MEWKFLVATSLTVSTTLAFMTLIPNVIMCTARYMPHETGSRDNLPRPICLQVMPVLASQASMQSSFHINLWTGFVLSKGQSIHNAYCAEFVISSRVCCAITCQTRIHEVYTAQVVIIVSMIHCITVQGSSTDIKQSSLHIELFFSLSGIIIP